jgi:hypothetical protein
MWESQLILVLWASTACYTNSFKSIATETNHGLSKTEQMGRDVGQLQTNEIF